MRHEDPRLAVADLLQRAVVGRGDDGQPGRARFGDHVRHPLAARKPAEPVHRRQKVRHVLAVAGELQAPLKAKLARQPVQLVAVFRHEGVGAADDDEARLRLGPGDPRGGADEILDPLLAVKPSDPAEQDLIVRDPQRGAHRRAAGEIELRQVHHRRDFKRVLRPVGHPRRGGLADAVADAHVARGEMLRPRQRLAHKAAMFDQRRAHRQPFQRRIDVGHVLRRDDDVGAADLAAQVVHRFVESERIGRRVHVDAERAQLLVALIRHPLAAEAGDHVDPILCPVERAGQKPHLGFLAADHEPGKDPQDADLAGVGMRLGDVARPQRLGHARVLALAVGKLADGHGFRGGGHSRRPSFGHRTRLIHARTRSAGTPADPSRDGAGSPALRRRARHG